MVVAEHAVGAVVLPVGELQRLLAVFNLEGLECNHIAERARADGVDGGGDNECGQRVEAGECGGVDLLERGGQLQRLGSSAGLKGAILNEGHAFGNSDGLYALAARECAPADVAHVRAEGERLDARTVGERLGGDGDGLAADGELLHGTVATEESVARHGPVASDVSLHEFGLVVVAEHAVRAVVLAVGHLEEVGTVFDGYLGKFGHITERPRADGINTRRDSKFQQRAHTRKGISVYLFQC